MILDISVEGDICNDTENKMKNLLILKVIYNRNEDCLLIFN